MATRGWSSPVPEITRLTDRVRDECVKVWLERAAPDDRLEYEFALSTKITVSEDEDGDPVPAITPILLIQASLECPEVGVGIWSVATFTAPLGVLFPETLREIANELWDQLQAQRIGESLKTGSPGCGG